MFKQFFTFSKKSTFILLLFFFVNTSSYSQQQTDSLRKVLETSRQDTSRCSTLLKLSYLYFDNNSGDSALLYANESYLLAEKLNNDKYKKLSLQRMIGALH